MAGQKFQYDESGSTFFYFILSFLALILIPATIYFWPKKKAEGIKITVNCHYTCMGRDQFNEATNIVNWMESPSLLSYIEGKKSLNSNFLNSRCPLNIW